MIATGSRVHWQHVLAIYLYTYESDIYRVMNHSLRAGAPDWAPFAFYLRAALESVRGDGKGQLLYRGVSGDVDLSHYEPGRTVTWAAFSSTSRSFGVAIRFFSRQGLLFVIRAKGQVRVPRPRHLCHCLGIHCPATDTMPLASEGGGWGWGAF